MQNKISPAKKAIRMKRRAKLVTSFFYLGHSRFMPGTMGSLGGLVVYFLVRSNDILYAFSILFVFTLGVLFAGEAENLVDGGLAQIQVDEKGLAALAGGSGGEIGGGDGFAFARQSTRKQGDLAFLFIAESRNRGSQRAIHCRVAGG